MRWRTVLAPRGLAPCRWRAGRVLRPAGRRHGRRARLRGRTGTSTPGAVLEVLGAAARAPGALVHRLVGRRSRRCVAVAARAAGRVRPAPAALPGRAACCGRCVLVPFVLPDRRGRRRLPPAAGGVRSARRSSASTGRPPRSSRRWSSSTSPSWSAPSAPLWESLDPRPRGGRGRAGRLARAGAAHRHPAGAAARRSSSAASVVFLFCATAFGVVLTLGGLRYSTVETEIYLLTTQLLDLQAAAALSVLQLVVVVGLLARRRPAAGRRRSPTGRSARRRPRAAARRARRCPCVALTAAGRWRSSRRRSLTLVRRLAAGRRRLGPRQLPRASTTTGDDAARCWSRSPTALANSLRTAVDATWMALLLGVLVVAGRHPPLALGRAERRVRSAARRLLHAAARRLRGDARLRLPDHPRPSRRSTCATRRCWCRSPRRWSRCRSSCAPWRRCSRGIDDRQRQAAASLGAGPLRALLTVDLPVRLAAAARRGRVRVRGVAGGVRRDVSFLARDDHPTLPVVIYRLIGAPRRARTSAWRWPPPSCSPPSPPS